MESLDRLQTDGVEAKASPQTADAQIHQQGPAHVRHTNVHTRAQNERPKPLPRDVHLGKRDSSCHTLINTTWHS
jgi:hypothetical protein